MCFGFLTRPGTKGSGSNAIGLSMFVSTGKRRMQNRYTKFWHYHREESSFWLSLIRLLGISSTYYSYRIPIGSNFLPSGLYFLREGMDAEWTRDA